LAELHALNVKVLGSSPSGGTMIKTAVIAAAGEGSRMRPLTNDIPKPLIEINGRPFLYHLLQNLKRAGITEIIIVTGHKKEKMDEFAAQYRNEFIITIVDQFETCGTERYGTSLCIEATLGLIQNKSFLCIYGDHLHATKDIKKFLQNDTLTYLGLMKVKDPEKYGVALTDSEGFLTTIVEKPKDPPSDLVNAGIYKFTPEIFTQVQSIEKSERGEHELTDAIQALAKEHKVKTILIEHGWHEFTTPADIPRIKEYLRSTPYGATRS
jgi:dTDP-glucose pyrophosphorylase